MDVICGKKSTSSAAANRPTLIGSLYSLLVIFALIQLSTQQFSYSANWGKRKVDYDDFEMIDCDKALRVKEFLSQYRLSHLERIFLVNYSKKCS